MVAKPLSCLYLGINTINTIDSCINSLYLSTSLWSHCPNNPAQRIKGKKKSRRPQERNKMKPTLFLPLRCALVAAAPTLSVSLVLAPDSIVDCDVDNSNSIQEPLE